MIAEAQEQMALNFTINDSTQINYFYAAEGKDSPPPFLESLVQV